MTKKVPRELPSGSVGMPSGRLRFQTTLPWSRSGCVSPDYPVLEHARNRAWCSSPGNPICAANGPVLSPLGT